MRASSLAIVAAALLSLAGSSTAEPAAGAGQQAPLVVTYSGSENASNSSVGGSMKFSWTERQVLRPGSGGFGSAGTTSTTLTISGGIAYTENEGDGTPCHGTFSAADSHTAPVTTLATPLSTTVTVEVPDSSQYVHSTGADPCSYPFAGVGGFSLLPPASWKNPGAGVSVTKSLKALPFSHTYKGSYSSGVASYSLQSRLTVSAGATCDTRGAPPADACYVALGDSYAAGLVDGTPPCRRSPDGYPYVYDHEVQFWACSGAMIATVEQTQLAHLRPTTRLVTITVGGNDTGIIGGIELCIAHFPRLTGHFPNLDIRGPICAPTADDPEYSPATFAKLRLRLADLYSAIHARAPQARIFVLGYPNPLPAAAPANGCPALAPLGVTSFKYFSLLPEIIPYWAKLLERLNATIRFAAADSRVAAYISPDEAFAGHDVCGSQPLFFRISILPSSTVMSLHPDVAGQIVLAQLLRKAAGPAPGE